MSFYDNSHRFNAGRKALRDALQALWTKHPNIKSIDAKKETPANIAGFTAFLQLRDQARFWKDQLEEVHDVSLTQK